MPRIVCAKCRVAFKPVMSGVAVVEMAGGSPSIKPQPYRLWSADGYMCPSCRTVIICGFGDKPAAEHFEPDFAEKLARCTKGGYIPWFERVSEAKEAEDEPTAQTPYEGA